MCGRFHMGETEEIQKILEIIKKHGTDIETIKHSGDINPGDTVPVMAAGADGRPSAFAMRWGYRINNKIVFNARSETAVDKPSFSEGMRLRRCVIPATHYYEWDAEKNRYSFFNEHDFVFLAGIYRMEENPVFTILTREPSEKIRRVHSRMPVVLPRNQIREWMRPNTDVQSIMANAVTDLKMCE